MVLELISLQVALIASEADVARPDTVKAMLDAEGIAYKQIPAAKGTRNDPASDFLAALAELDQLPSLIIRNGPVANDFTSAIPKPPIDADLVYLGTSQMGCLSEQEKDTFGLRIFDGLALARIHNENFLRVFSDAATEALLILSDSARARIGEAARKALNRKTNLGVRLSFALPSLKAYALRHPILGEPINPVEDGEVREATHKAMNVRVMADVDPSTDNLSWQVMQAVSNVNGRSLAVNGGLQALDPQPELDGYNANVLQDRCLVLDNARVFPPTGKDKSCGVTNQWGEWQPLSREYKYPRRPFPMPPPERQDEPLGYMKGTYLYAGWLHPHFGHFLAESTSRLWGLDAYDGKIDGVIFVPLWSGGVWRALKSNKDMLDLICGDTPIVAQKHPVIVEKLILPEPGFGHEDRMAGSDGYIASIRGRLARNVPANGPKKLYVSRSKLADKKGRAIGEELIENCMVANGYHVFHPQQHPIKEQLAAYRAADFIVGFDGSALHGVALGARSDAKIAVIHRRKGAVSERMADQIRRFSGADVTVIDVIIRMWVNETSKRIDYSTQSELDLGALAQGLIEHGFIDHSGSLRTLSGKEIAVYLNDRDPDLPQLIPHQ